MERARKGLSLSTRPFDVGERQADRDCADRVQEALVGRLRKEHPSLDDKRLAKALVGALRLRSDLVHLCDNAGSKWCFCRKERAPVPDMVSPFSPGADRLWNDSLADARGAGAGAGPGTVPSSSAASMVQLADRA